MREKKETTAKTAQTMIMGRYSFELDWVQSRMTDAIKINKCISVVIIIHMKMV